MNKIKTNSNKFSVNNSQIKINYIFTLIFTLFLLQGADSHCMLKSTLKLANILCKKYSNLPNLRQRNNTNQDLSKKLTSEEMLEKLIDKEKSDRAKKLFELIDKYDIKGVKNFNEKFFVDPNFKNDKGQTVLSFACKVCAGKEIVESLLKNGSRANINYEEENGDTPLIHSLRKERLETFFTLIENGASKNKKNSKGATPLDMAVIDNDKEAVKVLIENGVYESDIEDHVLYACVHNKTAILETIFSKFPEKINTKITIRNYFDDTYENKNLLWLAIKHKNKRMINFLTTFEAVGKDGKFIKLDL